MCSERKFTYTTLANGKINCKLECDNITVFATAETEKDARFKAILLYLAKTKGNQENN